MKRIILVLAILVLIAPLAACQGACGAPTATLHWPLTFGSEQTMPNTTVQVPMQAPAVQYGYPAAQCAPAPRAATPVTYSTPPTAGPCN